MDIQKIATIVRNHRKKVRLTQKELADLSGIGKTGVFDIEKGKPTVQMDTLLKVLGALNITIKLQSPLIDQFEDK